MTNTKYDTHLVDWNELDDDCGTSVIDDSEQRSCNNENHVFHKQSDKGTYFDCNTTGNEFLEVTR